jgi:hypothetical protein
MKHRIAPNTHCMSAGQHASQWSQIIGRRWAENLHDLGKAKGKHGVRLHVFNFYTDEVGNPEVPRGVVPAR